MVPKVIPLWQQTILPISALFAVLWKVENWERSIDTDEIAPSLKVRNDKKQSTEEGVISVWAWLFNSLLGEFSFPRNLTSVPITSRNQRSKSDFVCRQSVSDYVTITNTALPAETSFSDNGGLWSFFLPIIFLFSKVFSNYSSAQWSRCQLEVA